MYKHSDWTCGSVVEGDPNSPLPPFEALYSLALSWTACLRTTTHPGHHRDFFEGNGMIPQDTLACGCQECVPPGWNDQKERGHWDESEDSQ